MPDRTPLDRHRRLTNRNLVFGFFGLLFLVGGGLIYKFYGTGAAALGIVCMAGGFGLLGAIFLVMLGIEWLSKWLDREEE